MARAETKQLEQVSEFRRAWPVLLSSTLGIAFGISPIPFNMIGHLVPGLQHDFGWSRGEIMFSITIVGFTNAAFTPLFGILMDRIGIRLVAICSLVLFALAWVGVAFAPSLGAFYGLWLLMGVLGGASQPIVWTRGINAWFDRRRGLALGIALTGTGICGIFLNIVGPALVSAAGWRGAVAATAALPMLIALPAALAWFRDPDNAESRTKSVVAFEFGGWTAVRTPRFWVMALAFLCIALAYTGLYTNWVPLLLDRRMPATDAGLLAGLIGASLIASRLASGYLLDRYWAPAVSAPFLIAPVASCVLLQADHLSFATAAGAAILLGMAAGVESGLISYLCARYFGLSAYGRVYGLLFGAFGLGSAVSPALYGAAFDTFGSYRPMLDVAAVLFLLGGGLLFFLGRYPSTGAEPSGDNPVGGAADAAVALPELLSAVNRGYHDR